ncbi:hypothetical protein D7S86_22755 [Pararobbsia silviterrae]|uniref:Uncharacterized protein n=1 Tax=Pararobbsia silviterrae TaxID=1792498 RepID=A0A494XB50_9BURK|nr:hypothetical protein D7S86_22755 [Pararobbsia silviterrae]
MRDKIACYLAGQTYRELRIFGNRLAATGAARADQGTAKSDQGLGITDPMQPCADIHSDDDRPHESLGDDVPPTQYMPRLTIASNIYRPMSP